MSARLMEDGTEVSRKSRRGRSPVVVDEMPLCRNFPGGCKCGKLCAFKHVMEDGTEVSSVHVGASGGAPAVSRLPSREAYAGGLWKRTLVERLSTPRWHLCRSLLHAGASGDAPAGSRLLPFRKAFAGGVGRLTLSERLRLRHGWKAG